MSVIARRRASRSDDPRVVRTRAAVVEAARTLFLQKGYASTTMEDIATRAGLTKRTLYNNYADKDALFRQIFTELIAQAGAFAERIDEVLLAGVTEGNLAVRFDDLGVRLGLRTVRADVIAMRRALIAETHAFPDLADTYFDRVPGRVLAALAAAFAQLMRAGLLRSADPARAAAQFAYLVVGEPLDRALMTGRVPPRAHIVRIGQEGVRTFLASYGCRHTARMRRQAAGAPLNTGDQGGRASVRRRAP